MNLKTNYWFYFSLNVSRWAYAKLKVHLKWMFGMNNMCLAQCFTVGRRGDVVVMIIYFNGLLMNFPQSSNLKKTTITVCWSLLTIKLAPWKHCLWTFTTFPLHSVRFLTALESSIGLSSLRWKFFCMVKKLKFYLFTGHYMMRSESVSFVCKSQYKSTQKQNLKSNNSAKLPVLSKKWLRFFRWSLLGDRGSISQREIMYPSSAETREIV